ncbi:hypothetical protein [Pseudonocardia sp. ICBG162]|uniref:hypothetical protein n=1 Tax=Pseudonocardia sp. ICBG162 TaxID=2846761 RepID=UPI001CF6B092|nr:hypothetical protein [Pseudonocardia sp. ICBG162]
MNEYGVRFPVWGEIGPVDSVDCAIEAELSVDLHEWASIFNTHFDHIAGWDDLGVAAEHMARGAALRDRLQVALGSDCCVVLSQWEHGVPD